MLFAPHNIYTIKSGYSGIFFTVSFKSEPTEEEFLDSIIYRESLIRNPHLVAQNWRTARDEHTKLYLKKDSHFLIVVMPYDASLNIDAVFAADSSPRTSTGFNPDDFDPAKGVWLTEPATRTHYPLAVVELVYFVISFASVAVGFFCAVFIVSWLWYFLLRRLSEISSALGRR